MDLKSAYKQLAIAEESLVFAFVAVFNPEVEKTGSFSTVGGTVWGDEGCIFFFEDHTLGVVHRGGHIFSMILWLCAKMHYPQIRVKLWRCSSGFWDGSFAEDGDKATLFSSSFTALGVEVNLSSAAIGSIEFANTEKRRAELVGDHLINPQKGNAHCCGISEVER